MEVKKKRAPRRTHAEIDKDIMQALESLVAQCGFSDVMLMDLVNASGIETSVFYRRYQNIEEALNSLANKYDFWVNEAIDMTQIDVLGYKKFYSSVLKKMYHELSDSKVMQKLLLWELNEDTEQTRRTANVRESMNMGLLTYYDLVFKDTKIDIKCITALLVSGIYHLVLHKERSSFCTIDFNFKEAEKRLENAIDSIVNLIFSELERTNETKRIINRMIADGLEKGKICKYLNISSADLNSLTKKNNKEQ